MTKKLVMMILLGLILSVGVACSSEKEEVNPPEEEKEIEEVVEEDVVEDVDPPVQEEEVPTSKENIVNTLKQKEMIGYNLDQVKEQLGTPTVDHKDSIMHAWRYDFTNDSYSYSNELISVDVSGLTNGQMEAQLFIYFENNAVVSHSIYYLKDDEIMQYFVNEAGAEEFSASAD